jgi:LTXXQ motif family protein
MARLKLAVSLTALVVAGGLATSAVVAQQPGSGAQSGSAAPTPPQASQTEQPNAGGERWWRRQEQGGGWRDESAREERSYEDYRQSDRAPRRGGWEDGEDRRAGGMGYMGGERRDMDFGPGRRGHMMMGHGRMARLCGPHGGRMIGMMLNRLERITRPTEAQRAAFDRLGEAAARARDLVQASCPTERAVTPPGRLAAAEKHLSVMLEAIRTVRPASEEQKARLYASNSGGMRHQGWHDRMERFRDRMQEDDWADRPRRDGRRERRWEGREQFGGDQEGGWRQEGRRERPRWSDEERDERRGGGRGYGRDYDRDGWPDEWRGPS